jgi:hypothetical protein
MALALQDLGVRQRKVEYLHFHVDVSELSSGTNAGILEGTYYATATDNGTGDTTITLNEASKRKIHVVGCESVGNTGVAGSVDIRFSFTSSSTAVQVVSELAGANTDADFDLTIAVFGVASQQ